jgi:hypothetical protein
MTFFVLKEAETLLQSFYNCKICHVVESRKYIITWSGDLDNDCYFLIKIVDGVVTAACGEREMMLLSELKPIGYEESLKCIMDANDNVNLYSNYILAKQKRIPEIMKEIRFEDVMELFNWKYKSKKVELQCLEL